MAYLGIPFKGLSKLMGSTETKNKLNQIFPTKKNQIQKFGFFSFLKRHTTRLQRVCKGAQILQV